MPSDATHTTVNFVAYTAISALLFKFPILSFTQYIVFTAFFLLGTLVLSPDLDTNSKSQKRCGLACRPYKWAFRHRGTSHHWLWGTAARIIYVIVITLVLFWVVWVFGWHYQIGEGAVLNFMILHAKEIVVAMMGLFVSNVLHIALDKLA